MREKTHILANLCWVSKVIFQFDKKYIWVIGFSGVITGIGAPILTIISQEIINSIQKKEFIRNIFYLILIYIFLNLFLEIINYAISYYKSKFLLQFSLDFDEKIMNKSSKLKLKDFENSETYDMLTRAQYEGNGKLLTYFEVSITIFSKVITMLSYLFILFAFSPGIAGIILVIPFFNFLIQKKINLENFIIIKERTNDSRKTWYLQYIITHGEFYKEIKTYGLSNYFIERYKVLKERFNKKDLELSRKRILWLILATIIEGIVDGALFLYIILCGYSGKILIGNVLTYLKTIIQIKEQMINILNMVSEMNKESLYIDELVYFFKLDEENNTEKYQIKDITKIEIKHLYYRYKKDLPYVLEDINLYFQKGETNVVVGQNGSGKTTLIKLLMGFYEDYEGEILINDIELKEIDKKSLLSHIATLFQDFVKYETTFRENIAYGNLKEMDDCEKILEIAEKFGIKQLIQNSKNTIDCQLGSWFDNGKQISIGQWQKVALSRAFIKNADVYILDEPNAALDAVAEYELSQLYQNFLYEKISIIIAHKFNNFIENADKIVVLDKGKVVAFGQHEELIRNNSIYREMYQIQLGKKNL